MLSFRPFNYADDADYERLHAIYLHYFPDTSQTVEQWRYFDESRLAEGEELVIEVIEKGDELVGFGRYQRADSKINKYLLWITLDPRFGRQGIGEAYLQRATAALDSRNPVAIGANSREDQPAALAFLAKHGFRMVQRDCNSKLDLTTFEIANYQHHIDRITDAGYRITTFAAVHETDPNWQNAMYRLHVDLLLDVPHANEIDIWPEEKWAERVMNRPNLLPDNWFVAVAPDGTYAGMSNLWRDLTSPQKIQVGLTGVRKAHRRRGICTALKAVAIQSAKEYGALSMKTVNEENNPMYQINLRLGFEPLPANLEFERAWEQS